MINLREFKKGIGYLKNGNARQKRAYNTISSLNIMNLLSPFSPVLAGTIPLGIDIETSDLDILCYSPDLDSFYTLAQDNFSVHPSFRISKKVINGTSSVICSFDFNSELFEVFAQDIPVEKQNAYIHMLVEYRLLRLGGHEAREAIIYLKEQGMKTEPAFARFFQLDGDPYQRLIELSKLTERQLKLVVGKRGTTS